MFLPLTHPPVHAHGDCGETMVIIDGVEQKAHFLAFDLPQCDACCIRAKPARPPTLGSRGALMPLLSSVGCRGLLAAVR